MRYKLLGLLVTLPLVSLGLYLLMATDLFQKDKVAYVFDSSATVSRGLATQVRMEVQNSYGTVRSMVEGFDFSTGDFSAATKDVFSKDGRIQALTLVRKDDSGRYLPIGRLLKEGAIAQKFLASEGLQKDLVQQSIENSAALKEDPNLPNMIVVAFRLGEKDDPNHMIASALMKADDFLGAFEGAGLYSSFVITRNGTLAIGGHNIEAADLPLLRSVLMSRSGEGTAETKLSDGQTYLVSYASSGIGDLIVISKVDKSKALKAVEVLVAKSLLFFVALLASTLLISVFASNRLTSSLRELFEATAQMAKGDFSVRVTAQSNDEVGGLAESFNWMAGEVARHMENTAEKVRMEGELATVRTVQETLFPPSQSQFGPIRIKGHFEPASECGGDWWSYSRIGNKIFIYVGDATGHGAPAALITSAATSAAAVIETMPDITPGKALTILNRAIHQTSKGSIMMTFFVAAIDLDNNVFSYASASHDPPYLLRRSGEKIQRKDIVPLNDVNGPRLGEQKDFVYDEFSMEFQPGDQVFFYTDGIMDVQDPEGKKWGERTFLKTLIDTANINENVDHKVELFREKMNKYRSGATLIDDVTMVMCEYEKRAA